jgi:hypothetical protein
MQGFVPILLALSFALGAPELAAADDAPPDLVRMNDGRMVRGVILELVPRKFVVMRTYEGGVRRFEMDDVAYAGPASQATLELPDRPEAPDSVNVRLFGAQEGLSLYELVGTGIGYGSGGTMVMNSWGRLCILPCELSMVRGVRSFILEDARGRQARVRGRVTLMEDADLEVRWVNRKRPRIVRWVVGTSMWAAGLALLLTGTVRGVDREESQLPMMLGGGGLLAGGLATMMVAIFTFDYGKISFHPFGSLQRQN